MLMNLVEDQLWELQRGRLW